MGDILGVSPKGAGLSGSNKWPKGHTRLQSLTQQHEGKRGNLSFLSTHKDKICA